MPVAGFWLHHSVTLFLTRDKITKTRLMPLPPVLSLAVPLTWGKVLIVVLDPGDVIAAAVGATVSLTTVNLLSVEYLLLPAAS